jgi:hypothetical protein
MKKIEVVFSGGFGNQVLGLLCLEHLTRCHAGELSANFDYFKFESGLQKNGKMRWPWDLSSFNIRMENIEEKFCSQRSEKPDVVINDESGLKLKILQDLKKRNGWLSELITKDVLINKVRGAFPEFSQDAPSLVVHIRRGDYKYVASYLVPALHYTQLLKKLSVISESVYVLSDDPIEQSVIDILNVEFRKSTVCLSDNNAGLHFSLMALAPILVCANSQFSFAASFFNNGLVLAPKVWTGNASLDNPIVENANFLVL